MHRKTLFLLLLAFFTSRAWSIDYTTNGFLSLVGAKMIGSEPDSFDFIQGRKCPCFVADYNTGALYEDDEFSVKHDSKAGIQFNVSFTDSFSAVAQIVARAYTEEVKVEWLYASWDITSEWTFQAGRKRIPLYYYSEFQDVGIAIQWVRPPQPLYGWEASNYNGATLRYTGSVGDWSMRSSVYAGNEEVKDAGYNSIYYDDDQDSRWENIRGGDIEMSYEWFTGRFIFMTSENSITDRPTSDEFIDPAMKQSIMGLALNADFGHWFVLSEFNINTRDFGDGYEVDAPAMLLAFGFRIDAWTHFISFSEYEETATEIARADGYLDERFSDTSFTLRYDINPSMATKLQYQHLQDFSLATFVGDTRLLSLSFDMVF